MRRNVIEKIGYSALAAASAMLMFVFVCFVENGRYKPTVIMPIMAIAFALYVAGLIAIMVVDFPKIKR